MEIKKTKCLSCGANLKYDSHTHKFCCDYCGASYIDEKDDDSPDPRVELTPDDLRAVDPRRNNKKYVSEHKIVAIISIVFFLIFFFFVISMMFNMVSAIFFF